MNIRPAVESDIVAMCGTVLPDTVRAIAVEDEGKILAIAGVRHGQLKTCFSDLHVDIKKSPKTILKAVREVKKIIKMYDEPVYAIADEDEPTAVNFLLHVGFEYLGKNEQGEVFVWPQC